MWSLRLKNGNTIVRLLTETSYSIGRKDTDIIISDDSSVSRKHGTIFIKAITAEVGGTRNFFTVTVTDSSKFGTFYAHSSKDDFVKVNQTACLQSGDIVRFGVQHSSYVLTWDPLVVISSMMDKSSQEKLQSTVSKVGGKLVTSWQAGVTHLVMKQLILNVKVTQALASACHIVTEEYFYEMLEAVNDKADNPLPGNFLPVLCEKGLDKSDSFSPAESRKTIFKNRCFVFLSKKQMKRLSLTCILAGAIVKLIDEIEWQELKQVMLQQHTALIFYDKLQETSLITESQFSELQQIITLNEIRFIQEHEIGLAILYCSADVYTNPKFKLRSEDTFTQHTIPGASLSQVPLYAVEEPSLSLSRVPETVRNDESENAGIESLRETLKRTLDVEEIQETPAKTIKLEMGEPDGQIDDFLDDIGLGSSRKKLVKAKPAPKSRIATAHKMPDVQLPDVVLKDFNKPCKGESFQNKEIKSELFVAETVEVLPDSCIDDDSLWSCKADSQQVETDFKASNNNTSRQGLKTTDNDESSSYTVNLVSRPKCGDTVLVKQQPFEQSSTSAVIPEQRKTVVGSQFDGNVENLSEIDPNLPSSNLAIVTCKPLVAKRSSYDKRAATSLSNDVCNFKRFVKVLPLYQQSGSQTNMHSVEIPQIIGGRDFIKHINRIECSSGDAFMDIGYAQQYPEVDSQETNPFDELFKTSSSKRRNSLKSELHWHIS